MCSTVNSGPALRLREGAITALSQHKRKKLLTTCALWTRLLWVLLQHTARVKGAYLEVSSNIDNCRKSVSRWSQRGCSLHEMP